MRTAMSRLTKEGWVLREREGRRTFYRLSDRGVATFEPATRRIYASPDRALVDQWVVGLVPPRARLEADIRAVKGFVVGGNGLWTGADAPGSGWFADRGILTVTGVLGALPKAVATELAPVEAREAYQRLIADFSAVQARDLTGLDALAARILLIHRWRRIVLRNPDLPNAFQPENWPGTPCRVLVAEKYRRLSAEADAWLQSPLAGGVTALPAPDAWYLARFQSSR